MMRYTASANETFDGIALNIYGDERYAYMLLKANPQHCHKIFLEGGEVLDAPEQTQEDRALLPPWKRGA